MKPKAIVEQWVSLFNQADVDGLGALYHKDAVNHQITREPTLGKTAITDMFKKEFALAEMVCMVEKIHEAGDWAILEWKDPLGLRGCGFFHIIENKIKFQRGYWDQLSFLRQHNLPIPTE